MAVAKLIIHRGQIHGEIFIFIFVAEFLVSSRFKPLLLSSFNRAAAADVAVSVHRLDSRPILVRRSDQCCPRSSHSPQVSSIYNSVCCHVAPP